MRYEHARVLLQFARMNLAIARSKVKGTAAAVDIDVTDKTITQSKGYRRLRSWFEGLTHAKRDRFILDCQRQMAAINEIMRKAKETGEAIEIGEIEISTFDDKGTPLAAPPVLGGDE